MDQALPVAADPLGPPPSPVDAVAAVLPPHRLSELRRALRSGGLPLPDEVVELSAYGTTVYGMGRFAVRVEDSGATDAELARRLAALVDLHAHGVPAAKPLRPVPLRGGQLRVSVTERVMNEGPARFEELGAAVRRLHEAPLWCFDGLPAAWDPHQAREVLERHEELLGAESLQVLLEAVDLGAMSTTHPERCCHGSLTLDNVLWGPAGPRLVGWSHMGRASALSDLAHLVASVPTTLADPGAAAEVLRAFAQGYGDSLPDPVTVALVESVRHTELAARELAAGRDPGAHVAKVLALHPVWGTW